MRVAVREHTAYSWSRRLQTISLDSAFVRSFRRVAVRSKGMVSSRARSTASPIVKVILFWVWMDEGYR